MHVYHYGASLEGACRRIGVDVTAAGGMQLKAIVSQGMSGIAGRSLACGQGERGRPAADAGPNPAQSWDYCPGKEEIQQTPRVGALR